jgi:hypothetical protein
MQKVSATREATCHAITIVVMDPGVRRDDSYIFLARFNPSSCASISRGSVTGYEQNVAVHANAAGPSG